MKILDRLLTYPFLLLVGLAVANAAHAEGKLYLQSPAAYSPSATFAHEVKEQCAPESLLAKRVHEELSKQLGDVALVENPADAGRDKVIALTITQIIGVGGGAWSGGKQIVVETSLLQDGKLLGSYKKAIGSGGGIFGGFKGTCAILDRVATAHAKHIAIWLAKLKPADVATAPSASLRQAAAQPEVDPCSSSAEKFTGKDYIHAVLLLSQSDLDIRAAARVLYGSVSPNKKTCDLLAEITWKACSSNMDAETTSWLGKALGSTQQAEYANVLDHCLATTKDEKIQKYMTAAKDDLGSTTTDNPYTGGKLDLSAIRAQLAQEVASASRAPASKEFDALVKGKRIGEVLTALGLPDEITTLSVAGRNGARYGFVRVKIANDLLIVVYRGWGAIRFAYGDGASDWLVQDAASEHGLYWSSLEGRFASISDGIASPNPRVLRDVSQHLLAREMLDRDLLDAVAARINRDRDADWGALADGIAWLCEVLRKDTDGRYRQFLLEVAKTAKHAKVKRHAGQVAEDLPETTGEPYVPVAQLNSADNRQ